MPTTVLVTGGSGFIGGQLTRALVSQDYDVRVFYRPHDDTRMIKDLPIQHFTGDITEHRALKNAMKGCTAVFHTVGNMSFWYADRPLQYKVNVEGTKAVVETAKALGVSKMVHTSTVNTIGVVEGDGVSDEQTPFNYDASDFYYAITKKQAEDVALAANSPDFRVVAVNPGTVFGAGDINFNAGSYIKEIQNGKGYFATRGGTCCVHVDAVVAGHIAAFEKGKAGEKYILGGENLPYVTLFQVIANVLGKKHTVRTVPNWVALTAAKVTENLGLLFKKKTQLTAEAVRAACLKKYYSSQKATKDLDLPFIPFQKAVEDAVDFYKQNRML